MKVLVLGGDGNMGRRYRTILAELGHEALSIDVGPSNQLDPDTLRDALLQVGHVIIASPTEVHYSNILELSYCREINCEPRLEVLCEKPVTKNMHDLLIAKKVCLDKNMSLHVVNQYAHIKLSGNVPLYQAGSAHEGDGIPCYSVWDFTNSGKDGLHWDCFQIYALAEGPMMLSKLSEQWTCMINGHKLELAKMPQAYISMIEDWLGARKCLWGWDTIEKTTKKILGVIGAPS